MNDESPLRLSKLPHSFAKKKYLHVLISALSESIKNKVGDARVSYELYKIMYPMLSKMKWHQGGTTACLIPS